MIKKAEKLFNYGGIKEPDYWVSEVLKILSVTSFKNSDLNRLFYFSEKKLSYNINLKMHIKVERLQKLLY